MTVDDTTTAAKAKAALTDTQEIPAGVVRTDIPTDEYEDDDDAEVAARLLDASTCRRARRITGILALIAALGIGFYGGILYQKHEGSSSTSTGGSSLASAFRAAFAGRGGSSGGAALGGRGLASLAGGSGSSVVGTVSAVADGTLYVSQGSSSALVKVVTNPQSAVTTTQSSSVSAVQPGDTVIISGAKQTDGSFMASSIRDSGAATATGGGGAASSFVG